MHVCIHGPFNPNTHQHTGLCHDLGHGPFSHAFEYLIERIAAREGERPERAYLRVWKHEDMSLRLLDALIEVRLGGFWGWGGRRGMGFVWFWSLVQCCMWFD